MATDEVYCNISVLEVFYKQLDPDEDYRSTVMAFTVICVVAFVLNFGVVVMFTTEKSLRKRYHIFVGSLAISECVFVSTTLFLVTFPEIDSSITEFVYAICSASLQVSIETVLAIALERLLVLVIFPFKKDLNSPKNMFITCAVMWSVTYIVVGGFTMSNMLSEYELFAFALNVCVQLLVALTYYIIYNSLQRREKQLESVPSEFRISKRLLKTFSIVVFVFFMSWMPVYTVAIIDKLLDFKCDDIIYLYIFPICFNINMVHSAVTPILYVWRMKTFRDALVKRLTCRHKN
ncbi:sphingosine 1-phosphate receptor 2-like [Antedon mediterranea]|uniref:sphingosine 1-phosphate receptor 2-like n=1 Tax=Antedon mediterranea TaxID=105859 RepID=UPI003AF574EC